MPLPKLTADTIQRATTAQSYSRGESYVQSGAVREVVLRQQTLYAEVEGNEVDPYQVSVSFDKTSITQASCNCRYSFSGWCKHIVATLLVCVNQPETVEERPSLDQLLKPLTLNQTKTLIQSLVEENPRLIETVDFHATALSRPEETTTSKNKFKRKTDVNPAPYRRKVGDAIRHSVYGWEQGDEEDSIGEDIGIIIDEAMAFAENGDGHSARVILKAITDSCVQHWDMVDDILGDMPPAEFGIDLDEAWTEALLIDELTAEEQHYWQQEIESWQDLLGDFDMSLEALRQRWDYPPLIEVLNGNITSKGAWEGEAPDWADVFSQIRLKILAQQERYEDYLLLAQAEGQMQEYLTMLGQLGRVEEAIALAEEEMTTLEEAIALAKTLREQDKPTEALSIALQGLQLQSDNYHDAFKFAIWTRNLAEDLGDRDAALAAGLTAFEIQPSLKDYQILEKLSGKSWQKTKEQLLQQLKKQEKWKGVEEQIAIFLHENLVEDAIAKTSSLSSTYNSYYDWLVLKVMDAAVVSHSQWVIKNAKIRAQNIIDQGKASHYDAAVEWLKRIKNAYIASGQEQKWLDYRKEIKNTHERKRKLMNLMSQSRL